MGSERRPEPEARSKVGPAWGAGEAARAFSAPALISTARRTNVHQRWLHGRPGRSSTVALRKVGSRGFRAACAGEQRFSGPREVAAARNPTAPDWSRTMRPHIRPGANTQDEAIPV